MMPEYVIIGTGVAGTNEGAAGRFMASTGFLDGPGDAARSGGRDASPTGRSTPGSDDVGGDGVLLCPAGTLLDGEHEI